MKIQCDVCERAPAAVICCADEAALCTGCDVEIHAANKLASKHQRLDLQYLPGKLPRCDICQEKTAFIFCVEDRALFCRECDESIHVARSHSGNHQRFLATGIRVAPISTCNKNSEMNHPEPPGHNHQLLSVPKVHVKEQTPPAFMPSPWTMDEFLPLSDYESNDKTEPSFPFGELEWFSDIGLFNEQVRRGRALAAAEVPELPISTTSNAAIYRTAKPSMSLKKPRIEISADEEYFTVPDLG